MFHKLTSVTPLPDFRIVARFADGCSKSYDLFPLIREMHAFQPLAEVPSLFEQVCVDPGGYGISWNDDIDLDGNEIWEPGVTVHPPFDGLLSFSDAASIWGLNESTLRKAIHYKKLISGVDAMKFGKQWVVTREAMIREYGNPSASL